MKGVKHKGNNLQKADLYVKTMLKAYIGRNLLDNPGFYPILNSIDPAYNRAILELTK